MVPLWLQAGFWGLLAGSALPLGAGIGYYVRIPQRLIAAIMAFGTGVLISAIAFELMDEAYKRDGFDLWNNAALKRMKPRDRGTIIEARNKCPDRITALTFLLLSSLIRIVHCSCFCQVWMKPERS